MGRWGLVLGMIALVAACGDPPCKPQSCEDVGRACGSFDSCGQALDCGTCESGHVCSAAGQCVPDESCVAKTCTELGYACGAVDDGCGHILTCGKCQGDDRCKAGACCTPKTCAQLGAQCGALADGCGGTAVCDPCPAGKLCGTGGTANQCAAAPDACASGAWNAFAQGFFRRNCLACHAPFSDWTNVNGQREMISGQLANGVMPPGGNLDSNEKAWILQWLDCGAKK